jgi:GNAT superfamily N-acetyltransferase
MPAMPTTLRTGRPAERAALEALQRRSSLSNPGDREALVAHPDAIALPADQLEGGFVRVAERDGEVAGFAVLLGPHGGACQLDGLFVEPSHMRGGVGRALVEDAIRLARERGATRVDVVANSHAAEFYVRVGFARGEPEPTRFAPAEKMTLAL